MKEIKLSKLVRKLLKFYNSMISFAKYLLMLMIMRDNNLIICMKFIHVLKVEII